MKVTPSALIHAFELLKVLNVLVKRNSYLHLDKFSLDSLASSGLLLLMSALTYNPDILDGSSNVCTLVDVVNVLTTSYFGVLGVQCSLLG